MEMYVESEASEREIGKEPGVQKMYVLFLSAL